MENKISMVFMEQEFFFTVVYITTYSDFTSLKWAGIKMTTKR